MNAATPIAAAVSPGSTVRPPAEADGPIPPLPLNLRINDVPHTLDAPATIADAVARIGAVAPYAVAVNRAFVPRSLHATRPLADGDHVEVIRPVTGG